MEEYGLQGDIPLCIGIIVGVMAVEAYGRPGLPEDSGFMAAMEQDRNDTTLF